MPTKHALLIGVDQYPDFPENRQLRGCVADAKLMKNVLVDRFKFDESVVAELHDAQATRQGILAAMENLLQKVEQDDIVVFHFSGHGSQTEKSTDTDEGTGRDSTICPYDTGYTDPSTNIDIVDNEINEWLVRLSSKTRYISLTFDCCHSGTITRNALGARARGIPAHERSVSAIEVDERAQPAATRGTGRSTKSNMRLTLNSNYVVMSGCRDDESSYEFDREEGGEVIRNGALTHFLTGALLNAKPGSTYRDVFELARQSVSSKYSNQHPQIEGAQDREIFGIKDVEPLRYIAIQSVDGNKAILAGGAAHGLCIDSIWTVYPQGTKQTDDVTPLASIKIKKVGSLSALGVIVEGEGNVSIGDRCVETESSGKQFLVRVDLSQLDDTASAVLAQKVEASPLLTLAGKPATGDFAVFILTPEDTTYAGLTMPATASINESTWAVVDNTEAFAMPLRATSDEKATEVIVSNLEALARYRNALTLNNPDSKLNIEFNIYNLDDDGELHNINGEDFVFLEEEGSEFDDESTLGFEIINHEEKKVFVTILDFGINGDVRLFYPEKMSAEMLEPGKSIKIGVDPEKGRIMLTVPSDFVGSQGKETIKAIVTTDESDFRWLQQEGTRSLEDKQFALREKFEAAYNGPTTRFMTRPKNANKDADWLSITHSFQLKRRST